MIFCAVKMISCENASDALNGHENGDGQKIGTVSAVDAASGRESGACAREASGIALVALAAFAIDGVVMAYGIGRDVLLEISIGA